MKEYRVGEVFTTDEGKTVRCVRSNGLCTGCAFLTKIGSTPRCKAGDIDCSERSREDRQHVIFEEREELKRNTEYPVGKVLAFEGKAVEAVDINKLHKDCTVDAYYSTASTVPMYSALYVNGRMMST